MPSGRSRRGANKAYNRVASQNSPKPTQEVGLGQAIQALAEPLPSHVTAPGKYRFKIVQRLQSRLQPEPDGAIARYFEYEMMGASEFEWGAVPKALQRMREADDLEIRPAELTFRGVTKTLYFVGSASEMNEKLADFNAWLNAPYLVTKEYTDFDTVFLDDYPSYRPRQFVKTDAWWDFHCNLAWTFEPRLAIRLLHGFKRVPVPGL